MLFQKMTYQDKFEPRFMWLDIMDQTIHLSQFRNKERNHREASLSGIVSIKAGVPERHREEEDLSGRCLTIVFQRGEDIDLMLETENERNLWCDTLRVMASVASQEK